MAAAAKVDVTEDEMNEALAAEDAESPEAIKAREAEEKQRRKEEKKLRKKKSKAGLIFAVILLLIVGGLVAVVGFNVFGIRDKYLQNIISNIPILNNIIKQPDSADIVYTPEELQAQVNSLNSQLQRRDNEIADLNEKIDMYLANISRLQEFENQQAQFKLDKEAYETAAAIGNASEYQKFFETFNPDLAAELYSEVVPINIRDKEVKQYIDTIKKTDAKKSAKILEELIPTDMEMVVLIMQQLGSDSAAELLGAMATTNAAAIVRQMAPESLRQ